MTPVAPSVVVVIGAGAGGLDPLKIILEALPRRCRAAVAVVFHLGSRPSSLPDILSWHSRLPAVFASDGDAFAPGRIYIAPPDRHMRLAAPGRLRLDRTAAVHNTRPAVDPLFESAAALYGRRVVAAVLSGSGEDGAVGLRRVAEGGGLTVALDPQEAAPAAMPRAALANGAVRAMRARDIARWLAGLCSPLGKAAPEEDGTT